MVLRGKENTCSSQTSVENSDKVGQSSQIESMIEDSDLYCDISCSLVEGRYESKIEDSGVNCDNFGSLVESNSCGQGSPEYSCDLCPGQIHDIGISESLSSTELIECMEVREKEILDNSTNTVEAQCNAITRNQTKILQDETHLNTETRGVDTGSNGNQSDINTSVNTSTSNATTEKLVLDNEKHKVSNWMENFSLDQIREMQHDDKIIAKVIDLKRKKEPPDKQFLYKQDSELRTLCAQWNHLEVKNDVLYRQWEPMDCREPSYTQLVVPSVMRKEILHQLHAHKTSGHLGIAKTLGKLRQRFYWPGHKADVERWCTSCRTCEAINSSLNPKRDKMPVTVSYGDIVNYYIYDCLFNVFVSILSGCYLLQFV